MASWLPCLCRAKSSAARHQQVRAHFRSGCRCHSPTTKGPGNGLTSLGSCQGPGTREEPRQPGHAHLYCALPLEASGWKEPSLKEKGTEDGARLRVSLMTSRYQELWLSATLLTVLYCSPGWPQTQDSSCLSVLRDGMTGRCHHTSQIFLGFFLVLVGTEPRPARSAPTTY